MSPNGIPCSPIGSTSRSSSGSENHMTQRTKQLTSLELLNAHASEGPFTLSESGSGYDNCPSMYFAYSVIFNCSIFFAFAPTLAWFEKAFKATCCQKVHNKHAISGWENCQIDFWVLNLLYRISRSATVRACICAFQVQLRILAKFWIRLSHKKNYKNMFWTLNIYFFNYC